MREALGNLDRAIMSDDESDRAEFDLRMIEVGAQPLRVAVKRGPKGRPPFLLFNGIGANLELAEPFLRALKRTEAIIFDVPGVGGSPAPPYPYRLSSIARLAAQLLTKLGHKRADIGGVSWGGGIAQQFAHQHYNMCRKLVLAATSPGAIMVPGSPRVLWKMATPRRYVDKGFMRTCRSGDLRRRLPPKPAAHRNPRRSDGWSERPRIPLSGHGDDRLDQLALALDVEAASAHFGRDRRPHHPAHQCARDGAPHAERPPRNS